MPKRNNYDNMTKEELVALMREKNKRAAWKSMVTLPTEMGEKLTTEILPEFDCENVSQLVRKIVSGELTVTKSE